MPRNPIPVQSLACRIILHRAVVIEYHSAECACLLPSSSHVISVFIVFGVLLLLELQPGFYWPLPGFRLLVELLCFWNFSFCDVRTWNNNGCGRNKSYLAFRGKQVWLRAVGLASHITRITCRTYRCDLMPAKPLSDSNEVEQNKWPTGILKRKRKQT